MASRCRTCGNLVPRRVPLLPPPERLAELADAMPTMLDIAHEYDSLDQEPTSAIEFVRWADFDIQLAAGNQHGRRRPSLVGR